MNKNKNKTKCSKCGKEMSTNNIKRHEEKCGKEKIDINEQYKQENGKYKCPVCDKEFSYKGIKMHIWRSHTEEGKKIQYPGGWNKGLTKDTDRRVKKNYEKRSEIGSWNKGLTKDTDERIRNIIDKSRITKQKNGTVCNYNNSRGIKGWYKGYRCDSSWELAFVIYCIDNNIQFERNRKCFPYQYRSETRYYFPDFILSDGTYVEVKGYEEEINFYKYKYFPYELKVFRYNEMKPILEFVRSKYGKDFINLYEDRKESIIDFNINNFYEIFSSYNQSINFNILEKELKIIEQISSIKNSNINFSKSGWVKEVSNILEIKQQKVTDWMRKNMYDFWLENCFKRKGTKI